MLWERTRSGKCVTRSWPDLEQQRPTQISPFNLDDVGVQKNRLQKIPHRTISFTLLLGRSSCVNMCFERKVKNVSCWKLSCSTTSHNDGSALERYWSQQLASSSLVVQGLPAQAVTAVFEEETVIFKLFQANNFLCTKRFFWQYFLSAKHQYRRDRPICCSGYQLI